MSNCSRSIETWQVNIEEGMKRHDGLVHAFIRRQGGGPITYDEALHAGRIGLWRALLRYDPERGTAFSTYAWIAIYRHVRQAAKKGLRENSDWPNRVTAPQTESGPEERVEQELIWETLSELVSQLPDRLQRVIVSRYEIGEHPRRTLKEIGEELGVCGERVRQLQQEGLAWLRHPARSWRLRELVGRNTAADYRQVLAQNAARRRGLRGRGQ
jgi:RNA polymerase sigma factor (sigma-70 family)